MTSLRNGFCLIALLTLVAPQAYAQGITGRTVKIVVPYAAGGTGDVLARIIGQAITEKNGQSIIVEDRPGAGSIVGTEVAARAAPDGTTILLVENPFILSSILFPGHYDALTGFEPLCYVAATPAVFAVSSKSDFHTLADFIKLARSKPGAASYGSTGPASIAHIAGELLKRDAKADITYVPYPGSPPAMNATLAGTITAVMANYSDLKGQIDAGALRPIAVAAKKKNRSASAGTDIGRKRIQRCRCGNMVRLCRSRQNAKRSFGATFAIHFRCGEDEEHRGSTQESRNVHQSFLRRGVWQFSGRPENPIHNVYARVRHQTIAGGERFFRDILSSARMLRVLPINGAQGPLSLLMNRFSWLPRGDESSGLRKAVFEMLPWQSGRFPSFRASRRLFGTHLPTRVSELAASTHKSCCALRPLFSGKRILVGAPGVSALGQKKTSPISA